MSRLLHAEPVSASTTRLDLRRQHNLLYRAAGDDIVIIDVPPLPFLMIDGIGDPNTSTAYREAVEALYALAYRLKFTLKRHHGLDYRVMPLEGLWWMPNMAEWSVADKQKWHWTMLILQPDEVTPALVEQACAELRARKSQLTAIDRVRLDVLHEGLAAQVLHTGPYADEAPTIARLHRFIREHGYILDDPGQKHHEIYLSDPRRAAPAKMKTLIRQPVSRAKPAKHD